MSPGRLGVEAGVGGLKGVPEWRVKAKVPSWMRFAPEQSSAHVSGSSPSLVSFTAYKEVEGSRESHTHTHSGM